MEHVVKRRNSIFGHIARMPHTVPAHQALHCQVELSLGRLPDSSWKRRPGRPNKRWLDQILDDDNRPLADCGEMLQTWSFWSDATVLADLATTMTTSIIRNRCALLRRIFRKWVCRSSVVNKYSYKTIYVTSRSGISSPDELLYSPWPWSAVPTDYQVRQLQLAAASSHDPFCKSPAINCQSYLLDYCNL